MQQPGASEPTSRPLRIVRFALRAATFALVALTLLSLPIFPFWPLELLTHFPYWYATAGLLLVIFSLAVRPRRWALVPLVCVLICAHRGAPYTETEQARAAAAVSSSSDESRSLRLVIANVLSTNTDAQPLLEYVQQRGLDILVLLEITDRWIADLEPLRAEFPYVHAAPRPDNFGIAVFSRIPLDEARTITFGTAGIPSIHARFTLDGSPVNLLATHPVPPFTPSYLRARDQQLSEIAWWVRSREEPCIVAGDLNTSMWSPAYHGLARDASLINARVGHGVWGAWPVALPDSLRIPIDHILFTPQFSARSFMLGPDIGSDHAPIMAELRLFTLRP